MMTPALPRNADDITSVWLTDVLRAGGHDVLVAGARFTRIGQDQGFTGGVLYRIALSYDGPAMGAPLTLVAKLSPPNADMAERFFAANAREVAFYDRIAVQAALAVPGCYFAATDPEHHASLILLQDLGQARSVPYAAGLSLTDAAALVDALAQGHAAWWDKPELADFDGMKLLEEFDFAGCWARYRGKLKAVLGDTGLPSSFLALGDHLVSRQRDIFSDLYARGPVTCLHRDIQADNIVFDQDGRPILMDWQMMGKGRGTSDLGYALIGSVAPDIRRAHERGLIARYHEALVARGVTGYGLEQCWQDYLRSVAGKIFLTVVATVLFDNAGAHKAAWRRVDLDRLLAFCTDHEIGPATFAQEDLVGPEGLEPPTKAL